MKGLFSRSTGNSVGARAGAVALAALWLSGVAGACKDQVTYIECPPGTTPSGSKCLEVTPDTTPDTVEPEVDTSPTETVAPDTVETVGDDVVDATTETTETTAPGPTGAACTRNADCAGGTCLDWTGGYCTTLDCESAGCGAGERCLAFAGNHLCVDDCSGDADCRAPDQACKRLPTDEGLAGVCLGVDADAAGAGSGCADATDCAGAAACLNAFPGGYCATLGCDVAGCAAGSACVKVDGRPSCLLRCNGDDDCGSEVGAERRCGVLQNVDRAPVDVCISGIEGKALGQSCRSDFECTSGTCQVLGEGRCSQTARPCFPETVASDCNGAEFCQVTPESRVGLCSQPCALGGRTCPGSAYCLAEGAAPRDAWCRPACTGPGDAGCNAGAGLSCVYGIPISDSGQGRYACTRTTPGSTLASCNGDATCGGASCLLDGASGYCSATCGDDGHCAFGGACVFGDSERCYRACSSGLDCPSGYRCESPAGANRDVCVP